MDWTDVEDIAIHLYEAHPEQDPLKVRFTDLRDMILAFDDWEGGADSFNEKKLEAVQMAWLEEYRDNN